MGEYFFIVESGAIDTKNVIEVVGRSRGMKQLRVTEWNGGDQQLWSWTEDGAIESKHSRLVIDIKGEKTEEGTDVYVWPKTGNLNQRWQIENGMIRSRSGSDLNITKLTNGFLGVWNTGNYAQKWRFVPQAKWDAFELYLINANPLMKAMFLKTILSEHMVSVLGCSIEQYEDYLKQCVSISNKCADTLDEVIKDVGIAKTTGGGVSIAGGTAAIAGLLLAPFTAGASLALTVGGAIAAGAGGLTSLGAAITEHCYNSGEMKKIKPVMDVTIRTSTGLHSMLLEVCKEIDEAIRFMKTPECQSFCSELKYYIKSGKKIAKKTYSIWNAGQKGATAVKTIKDMKALAAFIEADVYAVKAAMTGTAEFAAAGGLKMPLTGKVLLQAGGVGAKAFSGALSVLGIVFGIIDVVDGSKQISEGSPAAKELRKSSGEIDKQGKALIATYKELFKK